MTAQGIPAWLAAWPAQTVILDAHLQELTARGLEEWIEHYLESGDAAREWDALLHVQRMEVRLWEKEAIARFLSEGM